MGAAGVAAWREASFFSPRERAALAWCEALTELPRAGAPEEVFAAVDTVFSPEETAALTFAIVAINGWNRVAVGLGLDVLSLDGLDLPGQASCNSTRRPSSTTTIRGSSAGSALASDRPCANDPFHPQARARASDRRLHGGCSMRSSPKEAVRRQDIAKAQRRTSLKAFLKMCDQIEGQYRIRPAHPAIVRFPIERYPGVLEELRSTIALCLDTVEEDRREVRRSCRFGDFAGKVIGIGPVGTEAFVTLLLGDREDEPLFLQLKEAQESVVATFARGQRVQAPGRAGGQGPAADAGRHRPVPGLGERHRDPRARPSRTTTCASCAT
jgi:hypothetical protein